MTPPIDYSAVLADLEAKRGQLDAAIAVIRALISGGIATDEGTPTASSNDSTGSDAPPARIRVNPAAVSNTTVQNDTFFRLSTPEAIRKYLTMMKRPQKLPDIARALLEGGQVHAVDATTAYNNVYAAIKRMEKTGEAVKIKTGDWGLAEWYGTNRPKGDGE